MRGILLPVLLAAAAATAWADQEASNRAVVRASEYGTTYAKSIPSQDYGQEGRTLHYRATDGEDPLLGRYDWYASEIYIGGPGEVTLVRFGPWQRGRSPAEDHLAIGFYRDGRTLREYSTLELVRMGSGISESVSHYEIFGDRPGFRWITGNEYVFQVMGVSGRLFSFDLDTGEIVEAEALTGWGT